MTSQPPDQRPAAQPAPDRLDLPDHAAPARMGRPPVWTPERKAEMQELICDHIAAGGALARLLKRPDMPTWSTVTRWLSDDLPDFRERYARARDAQADALADSIVDIAQQSIDGKVDPQAARTAVDALKWAAGKLKPKVYGDRIDVNSNVNVNVTPGWVLDLTPVVDVTAIPNGTEVQAITGPNEPDDPPDVD